MPQNQGHNTGSQCEYSVVTIFVLVSLQPITSAPSLPSSHLQKTWHSFSTWNFFFPHSFLFYIWVFQQSVLSFKCIPQKTGKGGDHGPTHFCCRLGKLSVAKWPGFLQFHSDLCFDLEVNNNCNFCLFVETISELLLPFASFTDFVFHWNSKGTASISFKAHQWRNQVQK